MNINIYVLFFSLLFSASMFAIKPAPVVHTLPQQVPSLRAKALLVVEKATKQVQENPWRANDSRCK